MSSNSTRESVMLPDDLWAHFLDVLPGAAKGIKTSIRLFSGEILEELLISNRGYILGRQAEGLAGYHGAIDNSMLTFGSDDIEGGLRPKFHFWERPKWVALNPHHPNRLRWQRM